MKAFVCTREHGVWETYKEIFAVTTSEKKASELCLAQPKRNFATWEEFEITN